MQEDLNPARFGAAFEAFMEAMQAAATLPESPLVERMQKHLGGDPGHLPVVAEEFHSFDHPNVQTAIDTYLATPGRCADLVGIGIENKHFSDFGLSELMTRGRMFGRGVLEEGPVDYVNFHLEGDRILPCVNLGIYLITDGDTPLVLFVAGAVTHSPRQKLRLEVISPGQEAAQAFLRELIETMDRVNVYRGHVISLSSPEFGPGPGTLISFHTLPPVSREDVILPEGVLERIERETVVFAEHADRLLAAGRSLKRGILLYGPPGVGKTLTIEYLSQKMPGRTIFLTAGMGLGMVQPIAELARKLSPAMIVLEDIDLIAEERGLPGRGTSPLLFELLNQMDGLHDDSDVIFVLTTNRPEFLERALAARPGRIDLAVELPLPDQSARRRLLELYAQGLELSDIDLDTIAERIEGATPAYKELLRKAAILAAAEGGEMVVTHRHLDEALAELDEGGRLAQRLLGFRPEVEGGEEGMAVTGFPAPSAVRTGWTSFRAR